MPAVGSAVQPFISEQQLFPSLSPPRCTEIVISVAYRHVLCSFCNLLNSGIEAIFAV